MIDYDNDFETMEVTCDGASCGKIAQFTGSFGGTMAEAKSEGWRVVPEVSNGRTDFYHFCSEECAKS